MSRSVSQAARGQEAAQNVGVANIQPGIQYDFETGTEGWRASASLGGIPRVARTCSHAKTGNCALHLELDLAPSRQCGEAYVNIPSTDLDGVIITAWVYAPPGARGTDPDHPNGLHLFAKDSYWRSLYGTWKNIQAGGWSQVTLTVANRKPPCGYLDNGFDPTRVRQIGINVCAGEGTSYRGFLLLDTVAYETTPSRPDSDHLYDFEDPGAQERLPHWDIVPAWGAEGWDAVTVQGGALVADADFSLESGARRKGFVGITYSPWLNLANKDHALISTDIKFVPSAVTEANNCPFGVSLWAYDDYKRKWFYSDIQNVGVDEWTTVTFDLNNPAEYAPGVQDYAGDIPTLSHIRQVGIQLWANAPYTGKVMFDNIVVGGQERRYQSVHNGIVTADGTQFVMNGEPFRFVGANAEYLYVSPGTVIEEVLDAAQRMGITVLRVWGLGEGCENGTTEDCAMWSRRFQPTRGLYNDAAFENFDRVVAMASERGIRLIVPLVNNWDEYGGMPQYVEWLASEHPGEIPPGVEPGTDAFHDLFYTSTHTLQWYEAYVTHFISRTNSLTGISYAEEPTIFAWELANEPRAKSDVSGATMHQWIKDMSDLIEGLDSNHMIGTGQEGWYVMTKANADARGELSVSTVWQEFPKNYWHYGVNWVENGAWWGSNGVDFTSHHSSTDTVVCWQDYVSQTLEAPMECGLRPGVPNIDFATLHLYIDIGACNLYKAPYCKYGFDKVLCNPDYDRPYNQAWLWMEEHIQDAHSAIGKPLLLEEFGFRISATDQASSGQTPAHKPPFTIEHRPRLFKLYLDAAYEMGYNGALFWNLGYPAFPDMPWDDCDSLDNWRIDPNSDTETVTLVPGPNYVTRGRYAFRLNYDSTKGFGKAFIDRTNIDENWVPTDTTRLTRLAVDICNPGDPISATVALVTGNDAIWYEARPRSLPGGDCTTIVVDAEEPEWKSEATGWEYSGTVDNLDNVRQLSIGLFNYDSSGTVYVDNLRHRFDDSLVIYPDDPAVPVITVEAWRWLGILRQVHLPITLRNYHGD
jgi:endo-1,4-beta-mannosidase